VGWNSIILSRSFLPTNGFLFESDATNLWHHFAVLQFHQLADALQSGLPLDFAGIDCLRYGPAKDPQFHGIKRDGYKSFRHFDAPFGC
jgi:hypothetical protein